MNVGELCWVELPARNGGGDPERRPAIIAQAPSTLPTVFIVPLTSQIDALRFPGTVLVEATPENGLYENSIALVFQLTAVYKRFISDQLGTVSDEVMSQIWTALDSLTGR